MPPESRQRPWHTSAHCNAASGMFQCLHPIPDAVTLSCICNVLRLLVLKNGGRKKVEPDSVGRASSGLTRSAAPPQGNLNPCTLGTARRPVATWSRSR
eukprot:2154229-Rhodomonas_salina.6